MKVIDLLNKIANGEEVPLYIKYYNRIEDKKNIMMVCKENIIYKLDQFEIELNDEVEITEEEKKIPEKINNSYYHLGQDQQNQLFKNVINEIIDYLKSKGDE